MRPRQRCAMEAAPHRLPATRRSRRPRGPQRREASFAWSFEQDSHVSHYEHVFTPVVLRENGTTGLYRHSAANPERGRLQTASSAPITPPNNADFHRSSRAAGRPRAGLALELYRPGLPWRPWLVPIAFPQRGRLPACERPPPPMPPSPLPPTPMTTSPPMRRCSSLTHRRTRP